MIEFSSKYRGVPRVSRTLETRHFNLLMGLTSLSQKLVLTGSTTLWLLEIIDRLPNDLDINLGEKLTPNELGTIKDFLDLTYEREGQEYRDSYGKVEYIATWNPEVMLEKNKLIQLVKNYQSESDPKLIEKSIKIDIFNDKIIRPKDMFFIEVPIDGYNYYFRCTHPSKALAFKMEYASDSRVYSSSKHREDLAKINYGTYDPMMRKVKFAPKIEDLFDFDKQNWNT